MVLVVITLALVAVGVLSYWYGAWKLSRYAARISGGLGLAVLLVPPVTFWFAFFKLEQEGKEFPTTMWLFGLVSTLVLVGVFSHPLSLVATGRMDELERPTGVAETAVAEYGQDDGKVFVATPSKPMEIPTPPPTPAATNGATGTNGAAGTNGATNNAPGNNAAPSTAGASTTSAPAQ